ncbi:MAG TPA: hypothetical protein VLI05_05725 [Candidatus Saccharimonadia bacterium]|nr:hypothetical protein [Candidatus Saccharimonadia bacterium]
MMSRKRAAELNWHLAVGHVYGIGLAGAILDVSRKRLFQLADQGELLMVRNTKEQRVFPSWQFADHLRRLAWPEVVLAMKLSGSSALEAQQWAEWMFTTHSVAIDGLSPVAWLGRDGSAARVIELIELWAGRRQVQPA